MNAKIAVDHWEVLELYFNAVAVHGDIIERFDCEPIKNIAWTIVG